MEKPGKKKWLHNRGYLAELTYERPTKNFTAPSFPPYVYPWRYLVGGFIKYFCEDRKLFCGSKHVCVFVWPLQEIFEFVPQTTPLRCHREQKQRNIKLSNASNISWKNVSIAKATYLFPSAVIRPTTISFTHRFFTKGNNWDIVTNRNWYNVLTIMDAISHIKKLYNFVRNLKIYER